MVILASNKIATPTILFCSVQKAMIDKFSSCDLIIECHYNKEYRHLIIHEVSYRRLAAALSFSLKQKNLLTNNFVEWYTLVY